MDELYPFLLSRGIPEDQMMNDLVEYEWTEKFESELNEVFNWYLAVKASEGYEEPQIGDHEYDPSNHFDKSESSESDDDHHDKDDEFRLDHEDDDHHDSDDEDHHYSDDEDHHDDHHSHSDSESDHDKDDFKFSGEFDGEKIFMEVPAEQHTPEGGVIT